MASLKLGDLFNQSHSGLLTFAENPNGQIIAIDDVPNGLKCKCKCPACENSLVAKNYGKVKKRHFAHHSEIVAGVCKSAGETALHKIAKEYLAVSLKLTLPELKVTDGEDVESIPEGIFDFVTATLEKAVDQVVPDVVVSREDGRKLIVEFKVTHACDEKKIAKIVSMNLGAIEVDLSQYREVPISTLADVILHNAPRKWLHSPTLAKLNAKIENRKSNRREANQRQAKHIIALTTRPLSLSHEAINIHEEKWRNRNFPPQFNGFEIIPQGYFLVRSIEWQSALFEHAIQNPNKRFSADDFLKILINKGFVDRQLDCTDNEVLNLVYPHLAFMHPSQIIWDFLGKSATFEKLQSTSSATKIWQLSTALKKEIAKQETANARRMYLNHAVEEILGSLPPEEIGDFDFEEWLDSSIAGTEYSFRGAVLFPEAVWNKLLQPFDALKTNRWPFQNSNPYFFNLPLERELERRLAIQKNELERKKHEESIARSESLKTQALMDLEDPVEFLNTPITFLNGKTPIQAAEKDSKGLENARVALASYIKDLQNQNTARDVHLKQKQLLLNAILVECKDSVYADLWCKSKNRDLGWHAPYEYCKDATLRLEAEALFKRTYKKKPNFLTK